jgi:ribosome-binding protein aMBF1 (putative translation factor)
MNWMPSSRVVMVPLMIPPDNLYPIHATWSTGHHIQGPYSRAAGAADMTSRPAPVARRSVAILLQQSRVAAHMSQKELATAASVPVRTIRDIESGELLFPRRKITETLSKCLGVDLNTES